MVSLKNGDIPGIIVPVTQAAPDAALAFIDTLAGQPHVDLVELRIDCLDTALVAPAVTGFVQAALARLGGKRSILTFRTAAEGGHTAISPAAYVALYEAILAGARPDFLDVEFNRGAQTVAALRALAAAARVPVILSSHDFRQTDPQAALLARLEAMRATGAEVVKLAVMPHDHADLLALLGATSTMRRRHPDLPLITMSMGPLGALSRLTGEIFGADATFGMIGEASAPGQIEAGKLQQILQLLHELS